MIFDSADFLKSFVAILAIVNPIGIVPTFLALTQEESIISGISIILAYKSLNLI